MDNVKLKFTESALAAAADKAIAQKTGARGLRSILETTLLDVMYEIPSLKGATQCSVDDRAIKGEGPVIVSKDGGELIQLPEIEKKSA